MDPLLHCPGHTSHTMERPLEASCTRPSSAQEAPRNVVLQLRAVPSVLKHLAAGGEPENLVERQSFLLPLSQSDLSAFAGAIPQPGLPLPLRILQGQPGPTSRKTCLVTPLPKSCSMALGTMGDLEISEPSSPVHPPCYHQNDFSGKVTCHSLTDLDYSQAWHEDHC